MSLSKNVGTHKSMNTTKTVSSAYTKAWNRRTNIHAYKLLTVNWLMKKNINEIEVVNSNGGQARCVSTTVSTPNVSNSSMVTPYDGQKVAWCVSEARILHTKQRPHNLRLHLPWEVRTTWANLDTPLPHTRPLSARDNLFVALFQSRFLPLLSYYNNSDSTHCYSPHFALEHSSQSALYTWWCDDGRKSIPRGAPCTNDAEASPSLLCLHLLNQLPLQIV